MKTFWASALLLTVILPAPMGNSVRPTAPAQPKLSGSIKPQDAADALRAVILSDREVFAEWFAKSQPAEPSNQNASGQFGALRPLFSPCDFATVHPNVGLNQSCLHCYNGPSGAMADTFKVGEPFGAFVVRIALEL
jgi:hypothetical protein